MQHREPPRPINFKRRLPAHLRNDPQVFKWAKRLRGDSSARPTDLSEEQLAFVTLEVAKRREGSDWLDHDLLMKAMADTTPILAAPRMESANLIDDLELLWSQPEMRRFWNSWDGERSQKGPAPDFLTGKALATVVRMAGISAHLDDGYRELTNNEQTWALMERLDGRRARRRSYENATRHLPRLAAHDQIIATNIEMIKSLAELHPGQGIGERLMIDGMGRPAWCEQAPKGESTSQEERRRRNCPEAGARAYIHQSGGKRSVRAGERGSARTLLTRGKFWRGYYDVCIADQATGLPLVWMSADASINESQHLIPLLHDLFRHWPECPATMIAGDSAWDLDPYCRLLEVDYGIHPIFRLHDQNRNRNIDGYSRDGTVLKISSHGQLVCAAHHRPLKMVGAELAQREINDEPLRPGQTANESRFRIRGECDRGCGRLGLQMQADWSRLTYYPHHGEGNRAIKERYAMRTAMLRRLNGTEAIWHRLQGGKKLGTADADRTRVRDKRGHDLLVDLGLLSMTAATLADVRRERGIQVAAPQGPAAAPAAVEDEARQPATSEAPVVEDVGADAGSSHEVSALAASEPVSAGGFALDDGCVFFC